MPDEGDDRPTPRRTRVAASSAPPPSIALKRRPRYALFVVNERAMSSLFELPEDGEVAIGRGAACSLRIDDLLLSRVHAVVRPRGDDVEVVDQGSRNGTWVGDQQLTPNEPRVLALGETIRLGASQLVLQFAAGGARKRRVWAHTYFEARLEEECGRASQGGKPFAVLRVHGPPRASPAVEEVLLDTLRPVDVLAAYADGDYEALLVDAPAHAGRAVAHEIGERLARRKIAATSMVACYPIDGRTPEALVARLAESDASAQRSEASAGGVVRSGALARLDPLVAKIAGSSISVLLLGETGVGKEVMARTIHDRSPRAGKPLVCLNCASLSESLLESELFGHEKGAFTGAVAAKVGLLESASGGTAFLDEVGEMPLTLQAKLLRVLEQREVLRVGALTPRPIDVRFLSATNRDLAGEIAARRFRQDLYFRLNGFSIVIPPLRERVDEIEPLARRFVELACRQAGRPPVAIAPDALEALRAYDWPGNIRELKNVIDRAVILCSGRSITAAHVAREPMGRTVTASKLYAAPALDEQDPLEVTGNIDVDLEALREARADVAASRPSGARDDPERARVIDALDRCAWNQTQAAKVLGISRRTLVTRLETYDLPRPRKRG